MPHFKPTRVSARARRLACTATAAMHALLAMLALTCAEAQADTYRVGGEVIGRPCDFHALQDAVDAAQAHPGEDAIRVARDIASDAQHAVVNDEDDLVIEGGYENCLDESEDRIPTRLEASGIVNTIHKLGGGTLRLRWLDLVASDTVILHESGNLEIADSEVHGSGGVGIVSSAGTALSVSNSEIHDNLYGINPQGVLSLIDSGVYDNAAIGILAYAGSALDITGSRVYGNGTDPTLALGGIWINPGMNHVVVSDSEIFANHNLQSGGGIHIQGEDPDHPALLQIGADVDIHDNESDLAGGGIFAVDTHLDMADAPGSRIRNNIAGSMGGGIAIHGGSADIGSGDPEGTLAGNHAGYQGGGLLATDNARVRLYTTDPAAPLRVRGNSAGPVDSLGGGIALRPGMKGLATTVYAIDVSIEENTAAIGAGVGIYAPDYVAGAMAVFCLQSTLSSERWCDGLEIPANAACVDHARCARIAENVAEGTYDGAAAHGAAMAIYGPAGSIYADHVRIDRNAGASVLSQSGFGMPDSPSELVVANALVTNNKAGETLVLKPASGTLGISCSTIAANAIGGAAAISAEEGVSLYESVIYQPGVLAYSGSPSSIDARFVLSHEVATLPQDPSVIAGDPRFAAAEAGDFHLLDDSPALDVSGASFEECANDLDGSARGIDLPEVENLFGPRDLGAFERPGLADSIFFDGFDAI